MTPKASSNWLRINSNDDGDGDGDGDDSNRRWSIRGLNCSTLDTNEVLLKCRRECVLKKGGWTVSLFWVWSLRRFCHRPRVPVPTQNLRKWRRHFGPFNIQYVRTVLYCTIVRYYGTACTQHFYFFYKSKMTMLDMYIRIRHNPQHPY